MPLTERALSWKTELKDVISVLPELRIALMNRETVLNGKSRIDVPCVFDRNSCCAS